MPDKPLEAVFLSSEPEDDLFFRRMQGREELGRLPEYRIELLRPQSKGPLKPDDFLGTLVGVKLTNSDEDKPYQRHFNFWVVAMEQGGVADRFDIYRMELRPWLWHLTLSADSRIFQDKDVKEILKAVFGDYTTAQFDDSELTATYRKRNYCVQYRETDFAFVSRLMEEEGIYYYFKHEKGRHTMVLCDAPSAHKPLPKSTLTWGAAKAHDQKADDLILKWRRVHAIKPLSFVHDDFDFGAPTTAMKEQSVRSVTHAKPQSATPLEIYDYPGHYVDPGLPDDQLGAANGKSKTEAGRQAKLRVNAFESGAEVCTAITPYRGVACGYTFTFADHPDKPTNTDYLITAASYELDFNAYETNTGATSDGFNARIQVVPKKVAFQPQPTYAQPIVHGPQTATVVGAAGEEITTDKYGRVKVQFRWDRVGTKNEKSSCWVRVSFPWAGKQFGMLALPRVGDEVVVEFLEGNPDRPLITGRVYNADNLPPYTLPAQATVSGIKTQSSKGGALSNANELRFDDKKGSEYVWFQAEKDMHSWVKNDSFASVLNNHWGDVTKNWSLKIGGTADLAITDVAKVKIDKDTNVKLGADLNMAVGAAMGLDVTGAIAVKGAKTIQVKAATKFELNAMTVNQTAKAAMHHKAMEIVLDAGMKLSLKAGGSFITLGPEGVTIQGALVKINSGGAGLSGNEAAQAAPPAPQEPAEPTKNKDPLPAADGGSGANA
jgi:type VI secretion system secreted protein VgrG